MRNAYVPYGKGIFRAIPVHELELANEEAGQGLSSPQSLERKRRIKQIYRELCGLTAQEKFLRLARLVNARIWMAGKLRESPGGGPLALQEDLRRKRIAVVDAAGTELFGADYSILPFLLASWWRGTRRLVRPVGFVKYAAREWRLWKSHA
jgi:hypothetical protein